MSQQNFNLTPNDLTAWPDLISMQTRFGPLNKPNDDGCLWLAKWILSFTSNATVTADDPIITIDPDKTVSSALITNTDLRDWLDTLFTNFQGVQILTDKTNYLQCWTVWPMLKFVYTLNSPLLWFQQLNSDDVGQWYTNFINDTGADKGTIPKTLEFINATNASKWTNPTVLQEKIIPLWDSQQTALNNLKPGSDGGLTPEQCVYLLYLLPSLVTGSEKQQTEVKNIVRASCSPPELNNSTFYQCLLYYCLMVLNDPHGNFMLNNKEITALLDGLKKVVTGTDKGSKEIVSALTDEINKLKQVSDYPAIDPNYPSETMTERMADLIYSLNQTWSTLN